MTMGMTCNKTQNNVIISHLYNNFNMAMIMNE